MATKGLFCFAFFSIFQSGYGLLLDDVQATVQNRVVSLEMEVASLKAAVSGLLKNQATECSINCPRPLSVAFMAELHDDLVNPATGHVVVFSNVITNVGNAYNPVHGIFTAPVNGTYNFGFEGITPPDPGGHAINLYIKKNPPIIILSKLFLSENKSLWLHRYTGATLHLTEGDEVWIEVGGTYGSVTLSGCRYCTHFSGFLVEAD